MSDTNRVSVSNALIDNYQENGGGQHKPTKLDLEQYYIWLRKMPEVAGVISAVCNDMMGEGYEFVGTKAGVKSAQEFVKRNHFSKKFYSVLQDHVLTGDSYMGIRIISNYYVNKQINKMFGDNDMLKGSGLSKNYLMEKLKVRSPDLFYPREVFPLKASTMEIDYDVHGRIIQYIQKVDGNATKVSFAPDEIVHFSLNNLGNDVYGSTPFISCLHAVATLWYAQDYAGTFFQNDAAPDRMYVLKNTAPGSPEYDNFKKQIETFKKAKNKHKSMVMTGEVEITDVNKFGKDLEFSNLIDKFTQRLMMAWNMPPSRLSEISGKNSSGKEALAGYYKNINRMQKEIEETLNSELFSRFGDVEIVFNKVYKRDESVEADIVSKTVGKPTWTQNEGRIYMGQKPLPDAKYDEIDSSFEENPGGQLPDTKEGEEVGNQHRPAEKMVKRGTVIKVRDFRDFKKIVEAGNRTFMMAKVLVEESENGYSFLFADSVANYEAFVSKDELVDEADFRLKYYDYSKNSGVVL